MLRREPRIPPWSIDTTPAPGGTTPAPGGTTPTTVAEDFSYFQAEIPGVFYHLGGTLEGVLQAAAKPGTLSPRQTGSLLDGAIYRADLRTGEGAVLVPGTPGRVTAGLSFDERSGLLWGVGSDAGAPVVFVYDGATGDPVANIAVAGGFLNDLVVTRAAVFVTDSFADVLWKIPLDSHGRPTGPAIALPLSGDFTFVTTGFVISWLGRTMR